MVVPWIIAVVHLQWQLACVWFLGGSWGFVILAVLFLLGVAAIDLPRRWANR